MKLNWFGQDCIQKLKFGSMMPPPMVSRSSNSVHDGEMEEYPRSSTADRHRENFAPPQAVNITTSWNESKSTLWRVSATFWCMLVMGANDAAYGAILPYLEIHYNRSYTIISLVFLAPFVGYSISAILNSIIHQHFGRRGVAIIGPGCHLLAFAVISIHPPFPVLVFMYLCIGFGSGIQNAAWNVWIGNMANSNEVLGFLHGFYGVGATVSPIIATTLINKAGWEWSSFYYIMVGAAMIELCYAVSAFWGEKGLKYGPESSNRGGAHLRTRHALTYKITWACAVFLFIYGGIEVGVGGWIVIFMTSVRHGNALASGMTETGFWLGITLGRFTLGFISPRLGERLSIAIYLTISICLELLFWLVPQFLVSAFAVSLIGFFTGTIFPGVVVVATRLLPTDVQVPAIGFAAALAMGGGSVFPFIIGAITQAKGVNILQPFILAMLTAALGVWIALLQFSV